MNTFNELLAKTQEIGEVTEIVHSIIRITGLPQARPNEIVLFENGQVGQVLSLSQDFVEILLLSNTTVEVGTKAVRTDDFLKVPVGLELLGKAIDPLGRLPNGQYIATKESRSIDVAPPSLKERRDIKEPMETGVALIDLIVPLAKGQRQLIIGDRKTGKTDILLQTIKNQSVKGTICIYAAIGKKKVEIKSIEENFVKEGIYQSTILISTSSSDSPGLVFITPYAAMTVAEYFRDQGKDVLLILDDLTGHAKYYREISLLARRFPGRSSYPGDIFYVHSKLLERAGKFEKGSITCLPMAESVLGDWSGYIQTNLMSMTDGHIFFDMDYFNQGRRPAINPFLSVTRVGQQAQSQLLKDLSREVSSFLVYLEKIQQFVHFGAELGESIRQNLALGDRITAFFGFASRGLPANVGAILITFLWAGFWKEDPVEKISEDLVKINNFYQKNDNYRKEIDKLIAESQSFADLVSTIKHKKRDIFFGYGA